MWQRLFKRRFKKRYVWIFLACLLLVALPALLLVSFVTGPGSGARVYEVARGGEISRQAVVGNGINLASLGADNFLIHGGFEPLVYRKDLMAAGGDASSILIASGDQYAAQGAEIPLDSFFDGAKFTVMSNRGGQLRVKHTGQVISCLPEQLSSFHNYELPLEAGPDLSWQDCLEQEGKLYLAGSQGYLLTQLRGDPQLYQSESQQNFLQLAVGPGGPLALDEAGQIFLLSEEGLVNFYRPVGFHNLPGQKQPTPQLPKQGTRDVKHCPASFDLTNQEARGERFKAIASLNRTDQDQEEIILLALTRQGELVSAKLSPDLRASSQKTELSLEASSREATAAVKQAAASLASSDLSSQSPSESSSQASSPSSAQPSSEPSSPASTEPSSQPFSESPSPASTAQALLSKEDFKSVDLPQGERVSNIFQAQDHFFLVTEANTLYQSSTGQDWEIVFSPEDTQQDLGSSHAWLCLSAWQDKLFLAGERGQALLWDPLTDIKLPMDPRLIVPQGPVPDFIDCLIISDHHLLLVDDQGQLYESVDAGESWQVRKQGVKAVFLTEDANLILSQTDGQLASAILGAQILTEPALDEGSYTAGDLVRLEQQSPLPWARIRQYELEARSSREQISSPQDPVAGDWYRDPRAKVQPILDQAPPLGGKACLALSWGDDVEKPASHSQAENLEIEDLTTGNPQKRQLVGIYSGSLLDDTGKFKSQEIRLSQQLTAEALDLMRGSSAFELSFWAKADSDQAYVNLDLTGPNMPSDPVRRYLTKDWSQYSVLFIIPWSVNEGSDLRLNFDFGQGQNFYLDAARLVKADRNTPYQEDLQRLADLNPSILRLSYLSLGQADLPTEYYLAKEGQYLFTDEAGLTPTYAGTLRQALQVTEEAQASPWLCLSSGVEESELRHLMQYLFGSRQSEYGLKRLQDGSISRWNEVFDTIYLEFTEDKLSNYATDRERSAFVDWAIGVISSTPEYDLVSHQLVFLDGMNYQEGSLLSSADAHSADYGTVVPVHNQMELQTVTEDRLKQFLRDPLRLGVTRPDLYRSLAAGESDRLADFLAQTLQSLGRDAILSLPNMSRDESGLSPQMLTTVNAACQGLAGHTPYEVKITGYEEDDTQALVALAFADRSESRIYVLNLGQDVELFRLRDAVPDQSQIWEYDWDGKLLSHQTMGWRQKTFTILPGAALVMSTPEP